MYNRYIPQQDGTYRKNSIPTPPPPPTPPQEKTLPEPPSQQPYRRPDGAFAFFRDLLPAHLDTGDLLIIVMLLLMAGDCEENKNNWLLTLALYLFL